MQSAESVEAQVVYIVECDVKGSEYTHGSIEDLGSHVDATFDDEIAAIQYATLRNCYYYNVMRAAYGCTWPDEQSARDGINNKALLRMIRAQDKSCGKLQIKVKTLSQEQLVEFYHYIRWSIMISDDRHYGDVDYVEIRGVSAQRIISTAKKPKAKEAERAGKAKRAGEAEEGAGKAKRVGEAQETEEAEEGREGAEGAPPTRKSRRLQTLAEAFKKV